jgi:hypothetical protein
MDKMDVSVVLLSAMIEGHLQNHGIGASSSSVLTQQPACVREPSLNIYRRRFHFRPQLYTFPFLFFRHPQMAKTSTA